MLKELLQEQQPIVYKALETACLENEVSSAYLFAGPYGTPKREAAILLAESIFCEKEGLACEECNTCRRVRENVYSDLIILDGKEEPISKDMIDGIQEKFSKTALEKNGQRVYIILNAENASISAQNSMLKFLEEPGAGITAILTADNESRLLPTILSRCTILPFVPMKHEGYMKMAENAGIPKEDAYLLSHVAKNLDDINELMIEEEDGTRTPSSAYESALGMFQQYLDPRQRNDLLVDYEISWKSKERDPKKAKKENMVIQNAFFDLMMMYGHDVILHGSQGPQWYLRALAEAKGSPKIYGKLIMIASEEKDRVNKYNDLNLLMDQTFCRLEELDHESRI
ncbi:MAG: DNA polymerase III subunit [Erysipelotrichaceae bacterium]|jgi:DNA polymerase-3 subunit delta'|nr:DNA polymerase III subunit [Erysipelotrichaceae bacterium]